MHQRGQVATGSASLARKTLQCSHFARVTRPTPERAAETGQDFLRPLLLTLLRSENQDGPGQDRQCPLQVAQLLLRLRDVVWGLRRWLSRSLRVVPLALGGLGSQCAA